MITFVCNNFTIASLCTLISLIEDHQDLHVFLLSQINQVKIEMFK